MSHPENVWAVAEELMSQNMLDVPIHIASPVIARVLASRSPAEHDPRKCQRCGADLPGSSSFSVCGGDCRKPQEQPPAAASEYERGRRDMEKLRDEWARRAKEFMALATKGDALWERSLTYTTVVEEVDALLAATSGTPGTGPKCSHGVLMREFCQRCEDGGTPPSGTPAPRESNEPICPVCWKGLERHLGLHDICPHCGVHIGYEKLTRPLAPPPADETLPAGTVHPTLAAMWKIDAECAEAYANCGPEELRKMAQPRGAQAAAPATTPTQLELAEARLEGAMEVWRGPTLKQTEIVERLQAEHAMLLSAQAAASAACKKCGKPFVSGLIHDRCIGFERQPKKTRKP